MTPNLHSCFDGRSMPLLYNSFYGWRHDWLVKSKTSPKPELARLSQKKKRRSKKKARPSQDRDQRPSNSSQCQAFTSTSWLHSCIVSFLEGGMTICQKLWMQKGKTAQTLLFTNSQSKPKTMTSPSTNSKSKLSPRQQRKQPSSLYQFLTVIQKNKIQKINKVIVLIDPHLVICFIQSTLEKLAWAPLYLEGAVCLRELMSINLLSEMNKAPFTLQCQGKPNPRIKLLRWWSAIHHIWQKNICIKKWVCARTLNNVNI